MRCKRLEKGGYTHTHLEFSGEGVFGYTLIDLTKPSFQIRMQSL